MGSNFRSPSKIARRLRFSWLAARKLKSWPRFMYHYSLGLVPDQPYEFRNGARIKIGRGVDHVPIIEVFMLEDYGGVPNSAVILDLGANIGAFSVFAAASAHDVRIYAYEPMRDFFRQMQENVRLNGIHRVVSCFNCAVGRSKEDRKLSFGDNNPFFPTILQTREPRQVTWVACTTLADILDSNSLERVDLLKMDCEGAEYEILYSTPSSCFARIGEIRMEYHNLIEDECNVGAVTEFLKRHQYEITMIKPNTSTSGNLWARRHG